jgi:hypothetical protein
VNYRQPDKQSRQGPWHPAQKQLCKNFGAQHAAQPNHNCEDEFPEDELPPEDEFPPKTHSEDEFPEEEVRSEDDSPPKEEV